MVVDKRQQRKWQQGKEQQGFTLMELMIVFVIITIIAAIAIPNYLRYVIVSKRADTMAELQNIAKQIESKKSAMGGYGKVKRSDFPSQLPKQGTKLYNLTIQTKTASSTAYANVSATGTLAKEWKVVATPITTGQMKDDGNLSLNYQGVKCRITATEKNCGKGDQWKK